MPLPTTLPADFGRYRLVRKLGEGGMGAVFLAEDSQLRRSVALKVPHLGDGADPEIVARFRREARVAAALDHPGLCPVYDVGEIDGTHYLTMPFLDGTPLSAHTGKPWLPQVALDLVSRLAGALAALHGRGLMHRDLKPANVMLTPDGTPVLMDFGLARGFGATATLLTRAGAQLGTPAYAAPEQADGDADSLGPATDVYALGVILYELLTGRRPFEAPTPQGLLFGIFFKEPPPPSTLRPDIDPALDAVCLKALAKDPARRYPGMAEFAAALDAVREGSVPASGTLPGQPSEPPAQPPTVAPAPIHLAATVAPPRREPARPGIAPFGVRQAQELQQAWAAHLGRQAEETLELRGGESLTVVLIPPGTFRMGSPADEKDRNPWEKAFDAEAAHPVILTRPFYLGKFAVTQGQYEAVLGKEINRSYFSPRGGGADKVKGEPTGRFPVDSVSWGDAVRFCEMLSKRVWGKVALPTEAEWEWACRAGTDSPFHFGTQLNGTQANCDGTTPYGTDVRGPYLGRTCAVGSYPPNAWGLHDVHGNVFEWCRDRYGPYADLAETDPERTEPGPAAGRVLRGGSWYGFARFCRAGARRWSAPSDARYLVGFRVAIRAD
jgi:formylglycine-generating enzyme required for sulfatase activity